MRVCYDGGVMDQPISLPVLKTRGALLRGPDQPKEKCAVFGVWGGPGVAALTYTGLFAQQHRGQESAGIAVSDGLRLTGETGMGLVAEVFDHRKLRHLEEAGSHGAIGHNRYSTAGGSSSCNAQPLIESY